MQLLAECTHCEIVENERFRIAGNPCASRVFWKRGEANLAPYRCGMFVPYSFRFCSAFCARDAVKQNAWSPVTLADTGLLREVCWDSKIVPLESYSWIPSQRRWGKDIRWNVDRKNAKHFSERRTTSPPALRIIRMDRAPIRGWNPPFAGLCLNSKALSEIICRILYFISYNLYFCNFFIDLQS